MPALFERLLDVHKKSVREHVTPDSEDDLWLIFRLVAATMKDLVLVVDGMDELSDHTGSDLLFDELVKVADNAQTGGNIVKVVITSRPTHIVSNVHTRSYVIKQADTTPDVAALVHERINSSEELHKLDPKMKSDISAKIVQGAEGMFLWAVLVIQECRNRRSDEDIEIMLKAVPKGLNEIYATILSSLDFNEDTRRIFSWLLVVARPLHLDEITSVLTTELGYDTAKERNTETADDVRKACGPLIKIEGGIVKFVHPSLVEYMTGTAFREKYGWTLSTCHSEVAHRSLAYLSFPIEGNFQSDSPGLEVTANEDSQQRLDKVTEGRLLLKYSIHYWAYHLLKSSPTATFLHTFLGQDCKSFPRHQALAWAENVLWPSTFTAKTKVEIYKIAVEIREAVFHHAEIEVIQTRFGLARAWEEYGDNENATIEYRKCWEACQELEGDQIEASLECAKQLALNLELRGLEQQAGEIYDWTWKALSRVRGPVNPQTLSAARELAWFHQKHHQDQECLDVYRGIWEVCIVAFGQVDPRSIVAGTTLARTCQIAKQDGESLKVYQTIWDAAQKECRSTDPGYLTAAIDFFQALENCSKQEDAEKFLHSLLEQFENSPPGSSTQALFINLKLELVRLYRRKGDLDKSTSTILDLNDLCCQSLCAEDIADSFLTSIEAVIAERRQPGSEDVTKLPELLYKFLLKKRSPPDATVVEAARQLALSYEHDSKGEMAKDILDDCFKKLSAPGVMNTAVIVAGDNLGLFYQKGNSWNDAAAVWETLLQGLWPPFVAGAEAVPPDSFVTEAFETAQKLGMSHEKTGSRKDAKIVYLRLFAVCQKFLGIEDKRTEFAAGRLSGVLQREGSMGSAIEVYKGIYTSRQEILSASSISTVEWGMRLARLYISVDEITKAEDVYIEMLNGLERDWGKSFSTTVEVSMALAEVYGDQRMKLHKAEGLYQGLWVLCLREKLINGRPGTDKWKFALGTVINLRNRLYRLYGSQRASVRLCRVAKEYRQMCLETFGEGHREHIIGILRYGEILTKWKQSTEAQKVHAELLRICLKSNGPYEEADVKMRMEIGASWEKSGRAGDATLLYEKLLEKDSVNNIGSMPELMVEVILRLTKRYKKDKTKGDRSRVDVWKIMGGSAFSFQRSRHKRSYETR